MSYLSETHLKNVLPIARSNDWTVQIARVLEDREHVGREDLRKAKHTSVIILALLVFTLDCTAGVHQL